MRTRLHRFVATLGPTVVVLTAIASAQSEGDKNAPVYEIPLSERRLIPKPGIDPQFLAALGQSGRDSIHGLVQLSRPLDADTLRRLNAAGVTLLEFLYGTTYIGSVKRGLKLDAGEGSEFAGLAN